MIQQFECPVCHSVNTMGNPACISCGEFFSYYCPSCRYIVNKGNSRCPNCNFELIWASSVTAENLPADAIQETEQNKLAVDQHRQSPSIVEGRTRGISSRRMRLWIILAALCILMLLGILFIDRLLNVT